jgi:uncharacterized protein
MRAKMKMRFPLLVMLCALTILFSVLLRPALKLKAAGDVPLLSDAADLLTDKEEDKLTRKLEKVSDKQDCDIAVYTVDDLTGLKIEAYADDIVDSVGLGKGRSKGTATLLVFIDADDPSNRKAYISTDKNGSACFSDDDIQDVLYDIRSSLSSGQYMDAFESYADSCVSVLKASDGADKGGSKGPSPFWIFGDLGIGAAIATLLGQHQKSKLKTKRRKSGASHYADHEGIQFERREDIFLDRRVERTLRERHEDIEGDHEHGTTHTSSSGHIHGGGGMDF